MAPSAEIAPCSRDPALLGHGRVPPALIKRAAGVQDSGLFCPATEACSNRIDAMLFAVPWCGRTGLDGSCSRADNGSKQGGMTDVLHTIVFMAVVVSLAAAILWLVDKRTLPKEASKDEGRPSSVSAQNAGNKDIERLLR